MIKGEIAAREKLIAIEPFRDKDGIGRCRLVMQPKVIAVSPRPMRPFQGWRYLAEDSAPVRSDQIQRRQRGLDAGADAQGIARSRVTLAHLSERRFDGGSRVHSRAAARYGGGRLRSCRQCRSTRDRRPCRAR